MSQSRRQKWAGRSIVPLLVVFSECYFLIRLAYRPATAETLPRHNWSPTSPPRSAFPPTSRCRPQDLPASPISPATSAFEHRRPEEVVVANMSGSRRCHRSKSIVLVAWTGFLLLAATQQAGASRLLQQADAVDEVQASSAPRQTCKPGEGFNSKTKKCDLCQAGTFSAGSSGEQLPHAVKRRSRDNSCFWRSYA